MKRLLSLLALLVLAGCSGGSSSPKSAPATQQPTTEPVPSISFLNGTDDTGHFHFDESRFGIACDQAATAKAGLAAAAHDAAAAFRKLADPQGQALADSVEAGDYAHVLAVCAANGASPAP